jgi:hypothetical protein
MVLIITIRSAVRLKQTPTYPQSYRLLFRVVRRIEMRRSLPADIGFHGQWPNAEG